MSEQSIILENNLDLDIMSESIGSLSGLNRLYNRKYNKGLAFTLQERQLLNIHGLLPPRFKTEDEQVRHCKILLNRLHSPLDKYMYLRQLANRNERLFYKVFNSDIRKIMPLVYTPTIGTACLNYSFIYTIHEGLFITINDKGHIYDVLKNWPEIDIRAVCVTDGEQILGLGDLGANGMGIPISKLSLYTALAGIKPHYLLPICLDVGTNNEVLHRDNIYIGLKQKRIWGNEYDEFLDEFVDAVIHRFGNNCLIHFENFGKTNAFRLLAKYRQKYCVMNGNIQGIAAVVVAAILASLKIKINTLDRNSILFYDADDTCVGAADLCVYAMMQRGCLEEEAKKKIWFMDLKGLVVKDRPSSSLTTEKHRYAHDFRCIELLEEAVDVIRPTILIGACNIAGVFSPKVLRKLCEYSSKPIILALSISKTKSECTAQEAYTYTDGKCIFASGSQFEPVYFNGKLHYTTQCNSAYIFPGIALGVILCQMKHIPKEIFLLAAEKLAEMVPTDQLLTGRLFPPLSIINLCCIHIAMTVMDYAYQNGLANRKPEPIDKFAFIVSEMYDLHYPLVFPPTYKLN